MSTLASLFRPRSVAIVGASDKNPWTGLVKRSLEAIGFEGPVHLVNRRGTPALGRATHKSCADLANVDAAFVAVPAAAMLDAIEDLAAGGIKFGVVVTSGFAETGAEGRLLEETLFDRATELGITLLGPNSLGFSNFVDRVSLSAIPLKHPILADPRVGLVSQSGATAAMLCAFAHQQNVALSHSIALGNEAMVDLADTLAFLVDEPSVRAIGVFAESIRDAAKFEAVALRAHEARKPIVILKVGVGELTATVAEAHTGALVGDDRVFDAVCDAYGIVRVGSLEDLILTADVLAATGPIDPSKGFALVSISGGACEIVADRGEEHGVPFPQFAEGTQSALAGIISSFGAMHNPLDVTGAALRSPEIYSGAIRAISSDDQYGLIGVIAELPASADAASVMSAGSLTEMAAGFAGAVVPGILIQQYLKPVTEHGRAVLNEHALPVLTGGIDHAMRAIGSLYDWSRALQRPARRVRDAALAGVQPVGELETLAYLGSCGVPVIPQRVVTDAGQALAAAKEVGSSVVLKILSPDIQHKTEVGGVILNVAAEDAGAAYNRVRESVAANAPKAGIDGVLISPMRHPATELIVGIVRDPVWGLALAVGMGGVWVELINDSALSLLPVTAKEVERMILSLKVAPLLTGYRGGEPADIEKLSKIIADIGDAALALGPDLEALEINPLRFHGTQIEALDALAVWRRG